MILKLIFPPPFTLYCIEKIFFSPTVSSPYPHRGIMDHDFNKQILILAGFKQLLRFILKFTTGAIDGTQIPIQGMSSDDEHLYICRKGFHSINVQAVVKPDLRYNLNSCAKYNIIYNVLNTYLIFTFVTI